MAKLLPGIYPVTEYCNLVVQQHGSQMEASCPDMPSDEVIRTAIKKRYWRSVTLSPWRRTAANGWTSFVTSDITAIR